MNDSKSQRSLFSLTFAVTKINFCNFLVRISPRRINNQIGAAQYPFHQHVDWKQHKQYLTSVFMTRGKYFNASLNYLRVHDSSRLYMCHSNRNIRKKWQVRVSTDNLMSWVNGSTESNTPLCLDPLINPSFSSRSSVRPIDYRWHQEEKLPYVNPIFQISCSALLAGWEICQR